MTSRAITQALTISAAAVQLLLHRSYECAQPQRILIAHHLLLGDTMMLTPLLAKLRYRYPQADLFMTVPVAIAPLYQKRPYGVHPLVFEPRRVTTFFSLLRNSRFDLAFIPGDNRHSWLAKALGARWIAAFEGDRPAYKNWLVNRAVKIPEKPCAWGDLVAELVPGTPPPTYRPEDWPDPDCTDFDLPASRYCVFHIGARNHLRLWVPERWRQLAADLSARGFEVVFTGSEREREQILAVDPLKRYRSYAGHVTLSQLWHLLKQACLLVCPDTGIAHLGRVIGVPTVALFGPGSVELFGAGAFWKNSRYRAVVVSNIECRNQSMLFKRNVPWMRHCSRRPDECVGGHRCIEQLDVAYVWSAISELLENE